MRKFRSMALLASAALVSLLAVPAVAAPPSITQDTFRGTAAVAQWFSGVEEVGHPSAFYIMGVEGTGASHVTGSKPVRSSPTIGGGMAIWLQDQAGEPYRAEVWFLPDEWSFSIDDMLTAATLSFDCEALIFTNQVLTAEAGELPSGSTDDDSGFATHLVTKRSMRRADVMRLAFAAPGVDLEQLMGRAQRDAVRAAAFGSFMDSIKAKELPGRRPLGEQPVDWDEDLFVPQAIELAFGHVLIFRQTWAADGYSLGTLLYSLPLAPGQAKNVAVVDWQRRDAGTRAGEVSDREALEASLDHSRDIDEVVRAALGESVRGGSRSSSSGWGAGLGVGGSGNGKGFSLAGVLGVAGGASSAQSDAWQDSAKSVATDAAQRVRDRVAQAAAFVRTHRTSTVTAVSQEESIRVTTEVVANHNHCHAMTVEYFEVLRHLAVRTELSQVGECVFVPLRIAPFDTAKVARWRDELRLALMNPDLGSALEAACRADAGWPAGSPGAIVDELVTEVRGTIELDILAPPPPPEVAQEAKEPPRTLFDILPVLGISWDELAGKPARWVNEITRVSLERAGELLSVSLAIDSHGTARSEVHCDVTAEPAAKGKRPRLHFRAHPNQPRGRLAAVHVAAARAEGPPPDLPVGVKVVVRAVSANYRTAQRVDRLVSDTLNDDIALGSSDTATAVSPPAPHETVNRHDDDRRAAGQLIAHLNAHLEHYHHAIWSSFDGPRRFTLLDGIELADGSRRSVADVVDNRVLGVVGNSLVFPVSPGVTLTASRKPGSDTPAKTMTLAEHYQVDDATPPLRISLPTGGVYAESVLGACNSCEVKDDTRLWRWEESPIDRPTAIEPVSTSSRHQVTDLTPDQASAPVVSIQNVAPIPDPTGMAAATAALAASSPFKDAMGLAGTQQNAAAALQQALQAAQGFGQSAAGMVQQQARLDAARAMVSDPRNGLSAAQRAQLTEEVIRQSAGLVPNPDRSLAQIRDAASRGELNPAQSRDLVSRVLEQSATRPSVSGVLDNPTVRGAQQRGAPVAATGPDGAVQIGSAPSSAASSTAGSAGSSAGVAPSGDDRSLPMLPAAPAADSGVRLPDSLDERARALPVPEAQFRAPIWSADLRPSRAAGADAGTALALGAIAIAERVISGANPDSILAAIRDLRRSGSLRMPAEGADLLHADESSIFALGEALRLPWSDLGRQDLAETQFHTFVDGALANLEGRAESVLPAGDAGRPRLRAQVESARELLGSVELRRALARLLLDLPRASEPGSGLDRAWRQVRPSQEQPSAGLFDQVAYAAVSVETWRVLGYLVASIAERRRAHQPGPDSTHTPRQLHFANDRDRIAYLAEHADARSSVRVILFSSPIVLRAGQEVRGTAGARWVVVNASPGGIVYEDVATRQLFEVGASDFTSLLTTSAL